MSDNKELYAKGFNNGYILAKHAPEIYSSLEKEINPTNDYSEGFVLGGKEYQLEKKSPIKSRTKDKDLDHDIEHDR